MEQERSCKVISSMHRDELRDDVPKLGEGPHLTIEDTEHVLVQISATPPDRPGSECGRQGMP